MRIHTKAKRRVLILLLAFALVATLAVGAYSWREHQISSEAVEAHETGVQAFEQGDYEVAMHKLGTYIARNPDDVETLYMYGQSRQKVPAAKAKNLFDAIAVYRRVLALQPDHDEARAKLMQLYVDVGFNTEALNTAEDTLAEDSASDEAVRTKAIALMRLQRFEEARGVVEQYTTMKPKDIDGHMMMLKVLPELGEPHEAMLAYAQNLREEHPDDPRFEVLQAVAYRVVDDFPNTKEWAMKAAEKMPPDATTTVQLVRVLDDLGEFDVSLEVLEKFQSENNDEEVQRILIRRIWQSGNHAEILKRLASVEAEDPVADPELLGIKALALLKLDKPQQAETISMALHERDHEARAMAWHLVLSRGISGEGSKAADRVNACLDALSRAPGHPYFLFFLGEAYHQVGEQELAMDAWTRSANAAPSWPVPLSRASLALLESGSEAEALVKARRSLRRAPSNLGSATTFAKVWFANIKPNDPDDPEMLLQFVNQIQSARPGDRETLPLQVALIERTQGVDAMAKRIDEVLNSDTELDSVTLRRLAMVSETAGEQELADSLLERAIENHGMSPQLAYDQATIYAKRGEAEKGRELLDNMRRQSSGDDEMTDLQWQVAWANFLRKTDDDEAADAWIDIADDNPDNSQIQRMALDGGDVWSDREFVDRAINRMRETSGERSIAWRVARARWLIQGEPDKREAAEAANLLSEAISAAPNLVEARQLLADAFLLAGIPSAAAEQLRDVLKIEPDNPVVRMKLAKLAHAQGNSRAAVDIANEMLQRKDLTSDQLRDLTVLFAQQGEHNRAIDLIVKANSGNETPPSMMLAVLYRRQGDNEKVYKILDQLLAEDPTLAEVDFAADVYASNGDMDRAESVIARLDEISASDADKQLVRAAYLGRHGSAEEALHRYEDAVSKDGEHEAAWLGRIRQLVRLGRADDATDAVVEAHAKLPNSKQVSTLHRERQLLSLADTPVYRPVLLGMVSNSEHQDAIINVLRHTYKAKQRDASAEQWVPTVFQLIRQSPRCFELQQFAINLNLAMEKYDQAADLALQAMQAFPVRPEPAELATKALAQNGRWHEVLNAARQWRERTQSNPMMASIAIAEAELQIGNANAAMQTLQPFVERASESPADYPQLVQNHTRALVALGQSQRAQEILKPLLDDSAGWRATWMRLAIDPKHSPAQAAKWLDAVEATVPDDAPNEHVRLAEHWLGIYQVSDEQAHAQRGVDILKRVSEQDESNVEAPLLLAYHYDRTGEDDKARTWYETTLDRKSDLPFAQNNLAMILLEKNTDLDRAYELADRAAKGSNNNPYVVDTLALVEQKRGNESQAIVLRRKIAKDNPVEPRWKLALALNLAQADQAPEAQKIVDRLLLEQSPDQWSPNVRDLLEQVNEAIDSQTKSTEKPTADASP